MILKLDAKIYPAQTDEVKALLTDICNSRFLWKITERKKKRKDVVFSPDKTIEFYGKNASDHRLQFKLTFREVKPKVTDAGAFYTPFIPLRTYNTSRSQYMPRVLPGLKTRYGEISFKPVKPLDSIVIDYDSWDYISLRYDTEVSKVPRQPDPSLAPIPTWPSPFAIAIAASESKDEDRK